MPQSLKCHIKELQEEEDEEIQNGAKWDSKQEIPKYLLLYRGTLRVKLKVTRRATRPLAEACSG